MENEKVPVAATYEAMYAEGVAWATEIQKQANHPIMQLLKKNPPPVIDDDAYQAILAQGVAAFEAQRSGKNQGEDQADGAAAAKPTPRGRGRGPPAAAAKAAPKPPTPTKNKAPKKK